MKDWKKRNEKSKIIGLSHIIYSLKLRPFLGSALSLFIQYLSSPIQALPNPASTYCLQKGGHLLKSTDLTGGIYGICIFVIYS